MSQALGHPIDFILFIIVMEIFLCSMMDILFLQIVCLKVCLSVCVSCIAKLLDPTRRCFGIIKLLPKPEAINHPYAPGKFRPSCLTPCISNVYTNVLRPRLTNFLIFSLLLHKTVFFTTLQAVKNINLSYGKLLLKQVRTEIDCVLLH